MKKPSQFVVVMKAELTEDEVNQQILRISTQRDEYQSRAMDFWCLVLDLFKKTNAKILKFVIDSIYEDDEYPSRIQILNEGKLISVVRTKDYAPEYEDMNLGFAH